MEVLSSVVSTVVSGVSKSAVVQQGSLFQYFLEKYSGASAAYSLRKLSKDATNAIRVRRSSDNSEQDIGFVGGDLDTESLLLFVGANDGFVTTWYDQSENSNDATQTVADSQPQIIDTGSIILSNGLPSMKYDGVNDMLSMGNIATGTSAISSFIVGLAISTGVAEAMFSQGDVAGDNGSAFDITGEIAARVSGNTIYDDDFVSTALKMLTVTMPENSNSSQIRAFLNSTELGQVSTTSTVMNLSNSNARIGVKQAASAFFDGKLSEMILFDSNELSNRGGIESNINEYFNIY